MITGDQWGRAGAVPHRLYGAATDGRDGTRGREGGMAGEGDGEDVAWIGRKSDGREEMREWIG